MKDYELIKGAYNDPDDIGPAIDNYMTMSRAGDYQYMPAYLQKRLYNTIGCWLDDNIDDVAYVLLNRDVLPDMTDELEELIKEVIVDTVTKEFAGDYKAYWDGLTYDCGDDYE